MEVHKISICIPTCNRLAFLKEALNSCLSQTLLPYEIIIGDDSKNKATADFINNFKNYSSITIKYNYNQPPLGQAANINSLFDRAEGDKIVLLHDDDLLIPEALEILSDCFKKNPRITAAFGKQYSVSSTGEIDYESSEGMNKSYFRKPENEGTKISAFDSGLLQQFPNDCFMVEASAAKDIRYRDKKEVGNACDFDFGFRLGKASDNFFFIDKYLAKYRLSESSIATSWDDDSAYFTYKIVAESPNFPKESWELRNNFLENKLPLAIMQAALSNNKKAAARLFFNHPVKFYLSGKALKLFSFVIFCSLLGSRTYIKVIGLIKRIKSKRPKLKDVVIKVGSHKFYKLNH